MGLISAERRQKGRLHFFCPHLQSQGWIWQFCIHISFNKLSSKLGLKVKTLGALVLSHLGHVGCDKLHSVNAFYHCSIICAGCLGASILNGILHLFIRLRCLAAL